MAKSEDGSDQGPGQKPQHKDGPHSRNPQRQGQQEKVSWVKGPGHDWTVTYQFEDDEPQEMSIWGCMTAEKALEEARFSLNGINDMNVGTYEILAVTRDSPE
jgi:hypothetical protein